MLNPQFARLFLSTIPNSIQGNQTITTSLGQELGLYRPRYLPFGIKDYRERKESIKAGIRKVAPSWVDKYFTTTEKKSTQKSQYPIGNSMYTKDELVEMLNAINKIDTL